TLVEGFRSNVEKNILGEVGQINKAAIDQIVNRRNFDRVNRMVDDALAKGAQVAVSGTMDEDDLTDAPTRLLCVPSQTAILQEEIFAPILPVMSYDTLDQANDYVASRDKPLALYVFSPNEANVQRVLDRTSSGGVTVNGVFSHYLENNLPFGGVN